MGSDFHPTYKSRILSLQNRYKELGKSGNCPIHPGHGDRTVDSPALVHHHHHHHHGEGFGTRTCSFNAPGAQCTYQTQVVYNSNYVITIENYLTLWSTFSFEKLTVDHLVNTVPTDGSVSHRTPPWTTKHYPPHEVLYKKRRAKRDRKRKNSSDRRGWTRTPRPEQAASHTWSHSVQMEQNLQQKWKRSFISHRLQLWV